MPNQTKITFKLMFFFLITEIVFLLLSNFVFFPSFGVPLENILQGMITRSIMQAIAIVFIFAGLFPFCRSLENVQKQIDDDAFTKHEILKEIEKRERRTKNYLIVMNVLGFTIVPIAVILIMSFANGYLLKASIRILPFFLFAGPAIAIVQSLFVNYIAQQIKQKAGIIETVVGKKSLAFLPKNLLSTLFLALPFVIALAMHSDANFSEGFGYKEYAIRIGEKGKTLPESVENYPSTSPVLLAALESDDPEIKALAEAEIENWKVQNREQDLVLVVLSLVSFGLFIGAYSVFLVQNNGNLKSIQAGLTKITGLNGDLTQLIVKTDDGEFGEIQVLINKLIVNLNTTFMEIYKASRKVIEKNSKEKESIQNLRGANEKINQSVSMVARQVSSQIAVISEINKVTQQMIDLIEGSMGRIKTHSNLIESTDLSFKEMDFSIRSVSDSSTQAAEAAGNLGEASTRGTELLQQMAGSIEDMVQTGRGISSVVKSIYSVADQIDMLAMNAAIEAAHAGDAGRGFAIVAAEIRELAVSTTRSTKEISKLLKNLEEAILSTGRQSGEVLEAMDLVSVNINDTVQCIREIAGASSSQMILSQQNMDTIRELVDISGKISESQNAQHDLTDSVKSALEKLNNASAEIGGASSEQEIYFLQLNGEFQHFEESFSETFDRMDKLEKLFKNIHFLDDDTLNLLK